MKQSQVISRNGSQFFEPFKSYGLYSQCCLEVNFLVRFEVAKESFILGNKIEETCSSPNHFHGWHNQDFAS